MHAAFALSDAGFETVMVNCNPETVSTDYDTSDRLFFEPLTPEDVLATSATRCRSVDRRGELAGVIVALGGQTPLKLARTLEAAGIPVLGTSPDSIDLAEDRERFHALCDGLGIPQPPGGTAGDARAARAGRPSGSASRCWCGRRTCSAGAPCRSSTTTTRSTPRWRSSPPQGSLGREGGLSAERPALIDRFLEDAIEVDVDALRDATGEVVIGGVMEHIEEAGVHSGDSACAIPPQTLDAATVATIEDAHARARRRARRARPAQRAVRGEGRPGARDRGEPAREPHGAVREQGDRRAAREGRGTRDGRRDAGRAARRGPAAPAAPAAVTSR